MTARRSRALAPPHETTIGATTTCGLATSRTDFAARTGADPDHVLLCTDPRRIALLALLRAAADGTACPAEAARLLRILSGTA